MADYNMKLKRHTQHNLNKVPVTQTGVSATE